MYITSEFDHLSIFFMVSVFETTIRYLGGLLSAYELSGQKYTILRDKAKEVADKMAFAWVGVSPMIRPQAGGVDCDLVEQ